MRTEPELVLDGVNEEEAACGGYNLRYPEKNNRTRNADDSGRHMLGETGLINRRFGAFEITRSKTSLSVLALSS
jgi:hypothetical protein